MYNVFCAPESVSLNIEIMLKNSFYGYIRETVQNDPLYSKMQEWLSVVKRTIIFVTMHLFRYQC